LTGVLAENLDRETVGKALRARRTFASTGERSFASLMHGDLWMGSEVKADPAKPLVYRLLGDIGWEEISLFDADKCVWRRNLHAEAGYSENRIRIRLGGARIKDRYRAANWSGLITIKGATILNVKGIGFDHPEQVAWREGPASVRFSTATHGDIDAIELSLSSVANCHIEVHAAITGYAKVGDPLNPPPHIHAPSVSLHVAGKDLLIRGQEVLEIPGVELRLVVERITDQELVRDIAGEIDIASLGLETGREHPLFITARQQDQSRIWTSPLFLTM
jgi:hypothetical protein